MNDATVKLIEDLAAQIGTTSEMVFEATVRQATVGAWAPLVLTFVWAVFTAILLVWTYLTLRSYQEPGRYMTERECFIFIVTGIAVVISIIAIAINAPECVSRLLNPEFWAIKQIAGMIR